LTDHARHSNNAPFYGAAIMFEIGVFGFIVFALGYGGILWAMGRREDVLHGHFVELEAHRGPAPAAMPTRPSKVAFRAAAPQPKPPMPTTKAKPSADVEALNALLVSIKQELNNAAKL
jgi:hypothetical protein